MGWRFDNTYAGLPEPFFAPATPARVKAPKVSVLNHGLSAELGLALDALAPADAAALADMEDEEYRNFVCIEPAALGPLTLEPGGVWRGDYRITPALA